MGYSNAPGSSTTRRWGDLLKFESAANDYFESFNPTSLLYVATNAVGVRPPCLRNAITARIDSSHQWAVPATGGASPVSLRGGVDLVKQSLELRSVINGNLHGPLMSTWTR